MGLSSIEWTHYTFNPWIGCAHVSDGCRFCYAERDNNRFGRGEWGLGTRRHITSEGYWKQPLTWNRQAAEVGVRYRVFCASMADVFEDHPDVVEARARLFALIRATPNLDWLLLTKRPENILRMLPDDWGVEGYPNVTLMTSVEDNRVRHRITTLQSVPCVRRGLSCEPLIGPLDLDGFLSGIHWVIVGGESGPKARPWHYLWPRRVRDVCVAAGVAFFYKQHGEWISLGLLGRYYPLTMDKKRCVVFPNGEVIADEAQLRETPEARFADGDGSLDDRVGKKVAGRELDGRTWDELPAGMVA